MSPDPIRTTGGLNLYAYGLGNPTAFTDRSGLRADACVGTGGGNPTVQGTITVFPPSGIACGSGGGGNGFLESLRNNFFAGIDAAIGAAGRIFGRDPSRGGEREPGARTIPRVEVEIACPKAGGGGPNCPEAPTTDWLPHSGGLIIDSYVGFSGTVVHAGFGASAAVGLFEGCGLLDPGGFVSYGGSAGPLGIFSAPPLERGEINMHLGGYAGYGTGIWVSNASVPSELERTNFSFSINLAAPEWIDLQGSVSLSYGQGIWVATVDPPTGMPVLGLGAGAALVAQKTTTKAAGCSGR